MIIAHISGIPFEESLLQLAPAGAAIVTAVAIAGRTTLGRLRGLRRLNRPPSTSASACPDKSGSGLDEEQ